MGGGRRAAGSIPPRRPPAVLDNRLRTRRPRPPVVSSLSINLFKSVRRRLLARSRAAILYADLRTRRAGRARAAAPAAAAAAAGRAACRAPPRRRHPHLRTRTRSEQERPPGDCPMSLGTISKRMKRHEKKHSAVRNRSESGRTSRRRKGRRGGASETACDGQKVSLVFADERAPAPRQLRTPRSDPT
ncbi:hypothetical protein EVAR_68700_1 [Eumeta japonica]|uniref:Uncharacterized protein n=1 Tax=Eumeta variegata TaxID=151549 RepID=A0A4C1ZZX1_EUMVA|nr:hypothetical protein EVAR_68700_1 [Eumeta japonica]